MPLFTDTNKMKKCVDGIEIEMTEQEMAEWQAGFVKSLPQLKKEKLKQLADIRYRNETAGLTLNGMAIRTDRTSQGLLNGAYSYVKLNPSAVIDWKTDSGWVQIDSLTVIQMAVAVAEHVQKCFSREKVLSVQIESANTKEELDSVIIQPFWSEL